MAGSYRTSAGSELTNELVTIAPHTFAVRVPIDAFKDTCCAVSSFTDATENTFLYEPDGYRNPDYNTS